MITIIIRSKRVYGLLLSCFTLLFWTGVSAGQVDETAHAESGADKDESVPVSGISSGEKIQELPSISVDAILPEDVRFAPGAANTLTYDEIEQLRPYTMHDAFDFIPGVRTIDDDALGRRSGIGIRGAPSRRSRKTLLLEDGVPINASTYLDSSAHYTPPMERLEAIDVLRGNGQILHGPLNNHGIVNFRNMRPTAVPETRIEIAGGEEGTFKRHLSHRRTEGRLGMVFSYTGANADGVFDIEDHQYDDFFGSLDWNFTPQHSIGASMSYFRERSDGYDESNLTPQEYFGGRTDTKRGRFLNTYRQEFNSFALDHLKGDIDHNFQITDRWSVSNKLFTTYVDRPRFQVIPDNDDGIPINFVPDTVAVTRPFVPGVTGRMESRDRLYRTYGAESRMEYANVEAFGLNHTFQWGLRAERHLFDDKRYRANGGVIMDVKNQKGTEGAVRRDESYQASAISGFFQDAMQFGNWTVTPGARVERYTQSYVRKSRPPIDPGPHDPRETEERTIFLPGISFLYDGFRDTEVFASVQRGYSPPSARTAEGFPLVPEVGINSQIGARTSAFKGVIFEVAGFYNILEDTIVALPFSRDGQNVVINSGNSDAIGVDVGLRIDSNAFYSASPYNVYGMVAYNFTQAEFTSGIVDGNRVPEIPLHAGSFTLGVEHNSGWDVGLTVSHFGSYFTDPGNTKAITLLANDELNNANSFDPREPVVIGEVESHTLLSARASYKLPVSYDMTLWIQGRNLTDKTYITDLENGIRPGAERTVIGGVQLEF